jgi:hypothetical protein
MDRGHLRDVASLRLPQHWPFLPVPRSRHLHGGFVPLDGAVIRISGAAVGKAYDHFERRHGRERHFLCL